MGGEVFSPNTFTRSAATLIAANFSISTSTFSTLSLHPTLATIAIVALSSSFLAFRLLLNVILALW
jgi:hypothetical protein